MKRLLAIGLLLLLTALAFSGCEREARLRDDLSCEALTEAALSALTEEEFLIFGEDHIRFSFENTDRFSDCQLIYSARADNVDEIGVFRGETDEDTEELRRLCEQYVKNLREDQRAFVASYAPREATKLDAAAVHVFGHYVVYTVLSAEDTDTALAAIRAALQ